MSETSRRKIGIFGTFDVRNWGDLLFPLLAQEELTRRLGEIEIIPFSYRSKNKDNWFYDVTSLDLLPEPVNDLDAIIIGGGHLIRFDKQVAPGYFPGNPRIHHPTAYWLLPALLGIAAGVPVIWNAPSSSKNLPQWAVEMLKPALHGSSYVAVRDTISRRELLRFAPGCEIKVVPDTAFGIKNIVAPKTPSSEYRELLERNNIKSPYVLLQASERTAKFKTPIHAARKELSDHQFVEIEIGPEIGDSIGGYDTWNLTDHVAIQSWPSPLCLAELVAHSSGAIATSLHLSLTSIAFGNPIMRPHERPESKYAPLEEHQTVIPMKRREPDSAEQFAKLVRNHTGSAALASVTNQLSRHWQRVANAITSDPPPQVELGTPESLMRLPFNLEP